jgi:hypothetical protein
LREEPGWDGGGALRYYGKVVWGSLGSEVRGNGWGMRLGEIDGGSKEGGRTGPDCEVIDFCYGLKIACVVIDGFGL